MSDLETRVNDAADREAAYVGSRMDANREEQWSTKRRDDESLRNSLERETESLDDPPEKISLDEKPYDRFARHADIRDDLGKAVDVAFYNSAQGEKREKQQAEFDLIGKKMQRRYGVDGVDGTKRLMSALEQIEAQPIEALQYLYHQYVEGDATQKANETHFANSMKDIEAVERKYDISTEVWSLVPDFMATPEFRKSLTGDNEADILRAVRMVKEGLKRVQFR